MALLDRIARFARDRRGNFATMMAIMILPAIGAVGLAVDFTNLARMKSQLQNANDAAVLYASRYFEVNRKLPPKKDIEDFLSANFHDVIESVNLYVADDNIWVDVKSHHQSYFMGLFSQDLMKVSARSAAPTPSDLDLEIVLALDTTGSMAADGKMAGLKVAATNFVNTLFAVSGAGTRVKIGMVPFGQYVNVGTHNREQAWMAVPQGTWNGCVGSRNSPLNLEDDDGVDPFPGLLGIKCQNAITPLTDEKTTLLAQIQALYPTGMTYIVEGVMWGQRVLSPQAPFSEGIDPKKAKAEVRKIMLLMTDGENTVSAEIPNSPAHGGKNTSQADNWTRKACRRAKDDGTEIFSVTFGKDVPKRAKKVMEDCASDSDHYFDAANAGKLDEAFRAIAGVLTRVRLTH